MTWGRENLKSANLFLEISTVEIRSFPFLRNTLNKPIYSRWFQICSWFDLKGLVKNCWQIICIRFINVKFVIEISIFRKKEFLDNFASTSLFMYNIYSHAIQLQLSISHITSILFIFLYDSPESGTTEEICENWLIFIKRPGSMLTKLFQKTYCIQF